MCVNEMATVALRATAIKTIDNNNDHGERARSLSSHDVVGKYAMRMQLPIC